MADHLHHGIPTPLAIMAQGIILAAHLANVLDVIGKIISILFSIVMFAGWYINNRKKLWVRLREWIDEKNHDK